MKVQMNHLKRGLPLLLRSTPKMYTNSVFLRALTIQSRNYSPSKTEARFHPKPNKQPVAEVFNEIFATQDKNEQLAALENLMKNAEIETPPQPPSESPGPQKNENGDLSSLGHTPSQPTDVVNPSVRRFSKGSLKNIPGLFIVPGADGSANRIAALGKDFLGDLFGFEFSEKEGYEFKSVTDAAEYYIKEMKKIQPNGPYNIGGISTGGPTAYEMALLLTEKDVGIVVFLDSTCSLASHLESMWTRHGVFKFTEMLLSANIDLPRKVEGESLALSPLDDLEILVQHFVKVFPHVSESDLEIVLKRLQHNIKLNVEYTPSKKFGGNVILVKTRGQSIFNSVMHDPNYYLEEYCTGPLLTHSITGSHAIFANPEYADQTTSILNKIWSSMSQPPEGDSVSASVSETKSESKI